MSTVERNVYCASYSLPYLGNESLVNAMHKAKNLYNATLWYYRQALEEHQNAKEENRDPVTEYPDYYKMERKFRNERQINYFDLPQKVSQWVLKDVQSDWRAFAKLVVWKKSLPDSDPRKQQEISTSALQIQRRLCPSPLYEPGVFVEGSTGKDSAVGDGCRAGHTEVR